MSTIPSTGQVSFGDLNEAMGLSRTSQRNSNDTTLRKFHDTSSSTTMKLSDFRNRSYFTVTQTGSQSAFNLKGNITYNVNGGVWPTGPIIANYIINSGVTLSGNSLPAFSTGTSWPASSKVYMTNGGTIQGSTGSTGASGASGAGGTGGAGALNNATAGGAGATGGTGGTGGLAAEFTVTSIVTNNGSIIGGTGGAGGSGGTGGGGGGGSSIGVAI